MKTLIEALKLYGEVYEFAPSQDKVLSLLPFWVIGYSAAAWEPQRLGNDMSYLLQVNALYFFKIRPGISELEETNSTIREIMGKITSIDYFEDEAGHPYYLMEIRTSIDIDTIRKYGLQDPHFRCLMFAFVFNGISPKP